MASDVDLNVGIEIPAGVDEAILSQAELATAPTTQQPSMLPSDSLQPGYTSINYRYRPSLEKQMRDPASLVQQVKYAAFQQHSGPEFQLRPNAHLPLTPPIGSPSLLALGPLMPATRGMPPPSHYLPMTPPRDSPPTQYQGLDSMMVQLAAGGQRFAPPTLLLDPPMQNNGGAPSRSPYVQIPWRFQPASTPEHWKPSLARPHFPPGPRMPQHGRDITISPVRPPPAILPRLPPGMVTQHVPAWMPPADGRVGIATHRDYQRPDLTTDGHCKSDFRGCGKGKGVAES